MTSLTFLDTNIFLRIILDDHIEHSRRARNLLDRVARGHEEVITSESAVAETVFTLTGKRLAMPRLEVADAVLNILSMDGVHLDTKSIVSAAFGRFVTVARLSFADCLHAA